MYENKFGNPEWEQTLDKSFFPVKTNECNMVTDIQLRNAEEMDAEALTILLNKYFHKWIAGGYKYCMGFLDYYVDLYEIDAEDKGIDEDDDEYIPQNERYLSKVKNDNKIREIIYTLQGLELEKYQILETSFKTLRDFFKSSVYQEKFPSDYVKFLEIRAYTTLVKEKKLSESEISKLSFDNYGKYAEKIERIVRFLMQDSPVEYDAVKKGASAKIDIPKQKESKCAVDTESKKRFWKDWSLVKKILYVILNMCTYCIPLVLHFAFVIVKKIIKKK